MFNKVLAITLVFSILTSSAMAASEAAIKKVFDDYYFALTVDWDQQDQAVKAQIDEAMIQKLNSMDRAEVISYLRNNVKNEQLLKHMDQVVASVKMNELSADEAQIIMKSAVEQQYSTGAAWSGRATIYTVFVVISLAVWTWYIASSLAGN